MKTLITLILLGFSTLLAAQTNIISLKSHAGDMANLHLETDNFGEIYIPPAQVDTVKFIRQGVIVEYRQSRFQSEYPITNGKNVIYQEIDTVKSPYFTKNLSPEFKKQYPASTIFIGFDREKLEAAKPYFDSIHKNGISFVALLLLAGIGLSAYFLRNAKTPQA